MPAEIKASIESKAKALVASLEVSQMKLKQLEEEPKTKCSRNIWDMLGGEDDERNGKMMSQKKSTSFSANDW